MRIAVIADDLTGAAEFNGIALRFGCSTYLGLGAEAYADKDIVVMSTDSRSMTLSAALESTERTTVCVRDLSPDFYFKKIDSVLRGYVLEEIKLQMKLLNKKRAIILPSNPSMGRTIESGIYYVHGIPIHETAFSHDPDFPVADLTVKQMLRCSENDEIHILNYTDEIPDSGIFIGNMTSEDDVHAWAKKITSDMLIACGGDLFVAFMKLHHFQKQRLPQEIQKPVLYVCGTTFTKSVSYVKELAQKNKNVFYIPLDFFLHKQFDLNTWINEINLSLLEDGKAILAINPNTSIPAEITPSTIRNATGALVARILSVSSISSLFIEGGSTAAAILNALHINSLTPIIELDRGVVCFQPNDMAFSITVKPGSYELPLVFKQFFQS